LQRIWSELEQRRDVRVIVLTGDGERAFCVGADMKNPSGSPTLKGVDYWAAARPGGFGGIALRETLNIPVIARVNGYALGGGFELALACDVLVASNAAVFGDTHARVGIVPGWGLSQKLPRLIGIGRAKELSFTGNFVDAQQALAWGLVNRVVAPAELLPACQKLAADMLSCDPASLRGYKQLIDAGFATSYEEGLRIEARVSRDHAKAITPEMVAKRRAAVQERGRRQTGG
jgi:enoyl-CoA hydratase